MKQTGRDSENFANLYAGLVLAKRIQMAELKQ